MANRSGRLETEVTSMFIRSSNVIFFNALGEGKSGANCACTTPVKVQVRSSRNELRGHNLLKIRDKLLGGNPDGGAAKRCKDSSRERGIANRKLEAFPHAIEKESRPGLPWGAPWRFPPVAYSRRDLGFGRLRFI